MEDKLQATCELCKHREYRDGYLYPYRCLKEKGKTYSEMEWFYKVLAYQKCRDFSPREAVEDVKTDEA